MVYYNDNEPFVQEWLKNLIGNDYLPKGDIDGKSIEEIRASEIKDYEQAHFFAGIGGWPLALRLAGWGGPVWTGSCPCQPFSVAGKRGGAADPRHLWPEWFRLIQECRPVTIFGEQVASRGGYAWFDAVQTDLEGVGYTVGMVVSPAAGFGAPHMRHRIYFVADAERRTTERHRQPMAGAPGRDQRTSEEREWLRLNVGDGGDTGELGDASRGTGERDAGGVPGTQEEISSQDRQEHGDSVVRSPDAGSGVFSGYWSNAEWLPCTDGKARPVEPGTFPLAHGVPSRVGRLRAYGNAICVPQAVEFIRAYMGVKS